MKSRARSSKQSNFSSLVENILSRMSSIRINWIFLGLLLLSIFSLFFWNEFLLYYVVLLQCRWPQIGNVESMGPGFGSSHSLKAMVIADTHLLGNREGHWFDKLRREWQMERTFQTAMMLHSPDIVFVLGDLFDEGKWCSDLEFEHYVERFHRMFRTPDSTQVEVVVGNHDIGFHYMIDEHKRRRFTSAFGAPSVRMIRKKGNIFVLLNSMAFEGDKCKMCTEAENELNTVIRSLNCAQGNLESQYCNDEKYTYSRPIIMQHFPMYRRSDRNCTGPDSAPPKEKNAKFQQKYDCLSKDITDKMLSWLKPRLIVTAHTHHFCLQMHPGDIPEWTVPSFSWRNKRNPSFLLLNLDSNTHSVHKCYLPDEQTVIYTYIIGGVSIFIWLLYTLCCLHRHKSTQTNQYYGSKTN